MKTIYKYPINVTQEQTVYLPYGAVILTIQEQFNDPCIWALVDPEEKGLNDRKFQVFGTGHKIANVEKKKYIGTFQLDGGNYVYHLFEIL